MCKDLLWSTFCQNWWTCTPGLSFINYLWWPLIMWNKKIWNLWFQFYFLHLWYCKYVTGFFILIPPLGMLMSVLDRMCWESVTYWCFFLKGKSRGSTREKKIELILILRDPIPNSLLGYRYVTNRKLLCYVLTPFWFIAFFVKSSGSMGMKSWQNKELNMCVFVVCMIFPVCFAFLWNVWWKVD